MYRRTLALLWTGAATFGIAAGADAVIDFMRNAQGILIAGWALFSISAIGYIGVHRINQTTIMNRHVAEQLRADINRLTDHLGRLNGQVGEVQNTVTLIAVDTIEKESRNDARRRAEAEVEARRQADRPLAAVLPLRLRDGQREAIVGRRTSDPVDEQEVWDFLNANDTGTLPGRFSAS
jgi:hypothetical protein